MTTGRNKFVVLLLALALIFSFALIGCGDDADADKGTVNGDADTAEPVTLVVGATPVPHAEILEFVGEKLREEGIEIEVTVYTDFVLPNMALDAGEIDANFFQHLPYLESFGEENGTDLTPITGIHFEPLGLYPGQSDDLDNIPNDAQIAIPSDPTNGARALNLLESAGIITLDPDAGLLATSRDITGNPHNVEIVEAEAPQLPRTLPDVDFAVINGNVALQAGIDFDTVLITEDRESEAALTYTNLLVAQTERADDPAILRLAEVLNSEEVRNFILEQYEGRVVPTF
ncbi:MAG: MetQ/NlpA family ABC transporter substrate-binding protein [Coriobacteriia bacterium]|nr:MetQ/NlpA family ABC transporter substrate-binding protein [Coriobacteriia bacterium]